MRAMWCAVFLAVLASVAGCGDESFPYNPLDPMVQYESVSPSIDPMEQPTFGNHLNVTLEGPDEGWVGGCVHFPFSKTSGVMGTREMK